MTVSKLQMANLRLINAFEDRMDLYIMGDTNAIVQKIFDINTGLGWVGKIGDTITTRLGSSGDGQ